MKGSLQISVLSLSTLPNIVVLGLFYFQQHQHKKLKPVAALDKSSKAIQNIRIGLQVGCTAIKIVWTWILFDRCCLNYENIRVF